MNEEPTTCVRCNMLVRQRDSLLADIKFTESELQRARSDRNKALVRVTELVAELNEFRTADDDYNAHAQHYAKKCAELRKELEQCKTPESPETEAERERKALIADRLGVPSGGFLGPHVMLALDERDHLRSELAMAMQAVKNLEIAYEQSEDELKALKATTSGGEVYVTGNGQPFTIIKDGVPQPSSNTGQLPPADQVEALARVLQCAYSDTCGGKKQFEDWPAGVKDGFRAEARAAIAHLATRPEGIPTAEDIKYLPGKPHVFNNELLIAAYKALKTRHALEWDDETNKDGWQRVLDVVRNATYETLRPWLRDTVGFELDVTVEEWADKCREFWTISVKTKDAFDLELKDFIKSRIKPVYECDCSAIEKERDLLKVEYESRQIMINNVRAALEGRPFKNTLEGE